MSGLLSNLVFMGWLAVIVAPIVSITAWLCWELEKAYKEGD